MAGFNGSGTFVRAYNWTQDAANAVPIMASRMDTEDNGFASGLSNCLTRDGQGMPSADIDWNAKKLKNISDATLTGDALSFSALGSFTATLTNMTVATTGTIKYKVFGQTVTLYSTGNILGTIASSGSFSLTGLPAVCRPSAAVAGPLVLVNNGTILLSFGLINASGSSILFQSIYDGTSVFNGVSGIYLGWQFIYSVSA